MSQGSCPRHDARTPFGAPPAGNESFAWVPLGVHHLAPGCVGRVSSRLCQDLQ